MNECCDWHGICLNNEEIIEVNNSVKKTYLSYCPECNSIFESDETGLRKIDGDKKFNYMQKYKSQIEDCVAKVK